MVLTEVSQKLSLFDRVGIVSVTLLGICIGSLFALASDLPPIVAVLCPGLLVGLLAARVFGIAAGVVASGVFTGAAYGILLYAWDRLMNRLRQWIARWSAVA